MLTLSLILFLLALLLAFGIRLKKSYDDKRFSWELALCLPGILAGSFVGMTLVYVNSHDPIHDQSGGVYTFAGFIGGIIAFFAVFLLSEKGASVGRALRDGGPRRVSNYTLFYEAENRLHTMGEQEQGEAARFLGQLFGALPGDVQFKVLESAYYGSGWTEPLAEELANWLRGELTWLTSGEGERVSERDAYGHLLPVRHLGVLLLPLLALHPVIAEMLREHGNSLAGQASSLQQEMDVRAEAHTTYTQKDGELKGVTERSQEISRLLSDDASEESCEQ